MKAGPQRQCRQTAKLVKRAQRVMRDSRELLEQREVQLRQPEQFLQSAANREIRGRMGIERADANS